MPVYRHGRPNSGAQKMKYIFIYLHYHFFIYIIIHTIALPL